MLRRNWAVTNGFGLEMDFDNFEEKSGIKEGSGNEKTGEVYVFVWENRKKPLFKLR